MVLIENGKSPKENIREETEGWVNENVKKELEALKGEVADLDGKVSFYQENPTTGEIEYDMKAVESYLNWLKDRPYAGTKIVANSTPWIMAVQIALDSKGIETGKVDGIY